MSNPFTLSFGKEPTNYIAQISQSSRILDEFREENPSNQVFMITGVRGSGKTVLLSYLSDRFAEDDWIVINLNPTKDMLVDFAAKLYEVEKLKKEFISAKIEISFMGMGIGTSEQKLPFNVEVALEKMLAIVKKRNKKILLAVDEVSNSNYIKVFVSSFQIYLRQNYPVYLLMTGLYENIYLLQNDKSLTFLYRAPKINMQPLNLMAICKSYMDIFSIEKNEALLLANYTKGYAFAYQVMGYLYWNNRNLDKLLPEYDSYLFEYVYEKVWSELSEIDQEILYELVKMEVNAVKVKDLRDRLEMNSNKFNVYRDRLIKKGILISKTYGYVEMALPRFDEYIKLAYF